MFKPSSGRKVESGVWEYFVYEAADDKSRCCVRTVAGKDAENHECGTLIVGKNATNLLNHLHSKHKDMYAKDLLSAPASQAYIELVFSVWIYAHESRTEQVLIWNVVFSLK